MIIPFRLLFIVAIASSLLRADRGSESQYAPPDAWLPGEKLPYFGSENPWDRRFFESEKPPRIGQPQYLMLVEGRIDDAIALCGTRLAADYTDVESHLVLALARGAKGQLDEANASLETALTLGLPPDRLLADRSGPMQKLHATAAWKRVAAGSSGLIHGPLLGAVTPVGARFWVRTLHESEVEVRVSERGDFEKPDARGSARTSAAGDFTGVASVTGLKPNTRYRYDVRIDGRPVPRGECWEFHTFPPEDPAANVRLAFGGGAKYFPGNERIWDTIRLRRPDALLLLGDNVYLSLPESVGAFHDYTYYQLQSRPEFRRVVASVPTFAIWDDHDAGIDDVFLGPYTDKPAWKRDYLELFHRNWNNPAGGAPPERPGVWFKFRVGPVECFMLDCRYYRENFLKENASMLGPVQKAWLLESLRVSTAPFKILVSSVPWADDSKIETSPSGETVYAKDTWHGYRGERAEIFDFLAEHRIGGVLLLSADRHRHDVRINQRPLGYPLIEIMSSTLTHESGGAPSSGNPIYELLYTRGFGFLTFDTAAPEPLAVIEIVTIEGESTYRREVKLSELQGE